MSDSTQWVGEIPADKLDLLIRKIQQKKAAAPQGPRLARRERPEEPAPLSFGQQQLWFMEQMDLGAAVYNLPAAIRCDGELRVDVLERALAEILRRHEALRTRFAVIDGRPAQQPVAVETQGPALAFHDLSGLPAAERETEAARRAEAEARGRFDLGAGRLLRATLLRLEPRRHLLLLTVHHLGADAWSVGLLLRELATLYTAFAEGNPSPLPEPAVQYADFALWQRERLQGATLDGLVGWWRERLGERPAGFEVPPDFPRPPVQTYAGARVPVAIGAAAAEALRRLGRESGTSLFATVLAVWNALLARWSGRDEVVLGTAAAQRPDLALEGLIGLFINTVVLRTDLAGDPSFRTLLERSRETALGAFSHAELPFQQLVEALQPERDLSRGPLFQIFFALQESGLPTLELPELTLRPSESYGGATEYDLALSLSESAEGITGSLDYNVDLYEEATVRRLADRLAAFCDAVAADPGRRLSDLPLLSGEDARQVELWSQASSGDLPAVDATLPEVFAAQAERRPEAVAAVHHEESLTYRELAARAAALAGHLRGLGIRPGDRVGVCADRSLPMLVSLLGVLETGAAYVPLDPAYPQARLAGMLAAAEAAALLIHGPRAETLAGTFTGPIVQASATPALSPVPSRPSIPPETPAYLLYTSGSTGAPKGVMVTHRNVAGFFAAMDQALADDPEVWPGVWLAVTSISFDISVLELLWTLTRGWKVVVQDETATWLAAAPRTVARPIDFSLFYFADAAGDAREKYRLLLEGARFADEHGFQAVWTPERHFHAFGGLYPNPSVTGAAVAATTRRIAIRAGSVVLPLHDPLRVAEEWAVVDNISGGRVGVSFASGWHADDFVFAPDRYADRKEAMLDGIETVRALWRGEAVRRRGGSGGEVEVRVLPRPLQPELPVWLTAAANVETFRIAGEIGAHVLTHLLGQTLEELAEKIAVFRAAWRAAGHQSERGEGQVTLMLHTFVGSDDAAVREVVRAPFTEYLRSSFGLVETLARSLGRGDDVRHLSDADREALLAHAFDRFFETSGLFGSPATCLRLIDRLRAAGVDEIGCLIDFGVEVETALAGLRDLAALRQTVVAQSAATPEAADYSLPAQIARHGVTHLQCTPSLAGLLAGDAATLDALKPLRALLLGGEALPAPLAERLRGALPAALHNMYGPTEATIWSLTETVGKTGGRVAIGRPLANNRVRVVDRALRAVPPGVAGEILLGGEAVAPGYWRDPARTAERFVPDPFSALPGLRLYRTGDLGRFRADGRLDFLGRADHQVKIRGHRIELGEIEATLRACPGVAEAVVVAREDVPGDRRLAAYVVPAPGAAPLRPQGDLPEGRPRVRLPDGTLVTYVTEFQVGNGYREIFEEETYLRHGIALPEGARVLDVGANIGFFSLFVHQRARGARVWSFEPFPATFAALRANLELYGVDARLFHRGVSDRPGSAEFVFYPNAPGLSGRFAGTPEDLAENRALILDWLETSGAGKGLPPDQLEDVLAEYLRSEPFPVELVTLSDVLREEGIERIDLLKVDAEKSEADILAGLSDEDWPKIRQVVLEVHGDELLERVGAVLRARGFDFTVADHAVAPAQDGLEAVRVTMVYARRPEDPVEPSAPRLSAGVLRRWLADRLPEAMVPSDLLLLDALPLTGSGKVDRRALPRPESPTRGETPYVAPRTQAEQTIAAVWEELLGRGRVGVQDNFFEVGGNSLLLVQVHARLREALGREVAMVQLFRHPTVQGLAGFLEGLEGEGREAAAVEEAEDRARLGTEAFRQGAAFDRQRQFLEERRKRRGADRRPGVR